MNPLLGIDFGTTSTAAALVIGRDIAVVPHAGGALSIPSVVSFTPSSAGGRTLVGAEAVATARHPERTITAVKRLLGRKLEASEVRHQRQEAPYELVMAKNGDVRVRVGRRHLSPPDIAGYIFDAVRAAASRVAGQPVEETVLAMPADFNDLQRQAVRDAARIGGLKVVATITGPAAVALAAGLYPLPRGTDKKEDHRVLVYDLGGGSFDVAALVVRDEGMEVLASGGDAFLGGEDFDQRIVSFICEEFLRAGGSDLRRERLVLPRLRVAAERAKRALSGEDEVQIRMPELAARLPEGVRLSRERLEGLTQDLIDRTVWPCESVLRDADWSVEDVDALVMVGGQTNMPRVRAHIAEWLGKAPIDVPSPPEALVALGAARQGLALLDGAGAAGGRGRKRKASLPPVVEATCLSLGVESAGGVMARLIAKGTPLPATASQGLTTSTDNQAHVVVHLVQGEREMAADNDSIARLQIGPLPPAPRGTPQIEIEIVTDGGGLPRAAARDVTTGEPVGVRVRPSGGLTEAELAALVAIHAGTPPPVPAMAAETAAPDEAGAPAAAMVALTSGPAPLVDPNEHRG